MFNNLGVGPGPKKRTPLPPMIGGDGKKPGLDVMVAVGRPKPGLGDGATPDGAMTDHEASESPQEEQNEGYGEKLIPMLAAVGQKYGADEATSKALAADFLDALAKCLRGGEMGQDGMGS